MVRAKFVVHSINRTMGCKARKDADGKNVVNEKGYAQYDPAELWTATLNPVSASGDPNHENTKFWEASPSGQIQLGTVNKSAVDHFELGKEFYVDFTPAP